MREKLKDRLLPLLEEKQNEYLVSLILRYFLYHSHDIVRNMYLLYQHAHIYQNDEYSILILLEVLAK